jgi:hypothetical protein
MNYIDRIKQIQSIWKELVLFGSWLGAIAGSFIFPLPDWDSIDQRTYNTRFILFITTIIAGFILLMTYKFKSKKIWLWVSVTTFILLIISYYLYNIKMEANTLPYYGTTKVVGSIPLHDFENKIKLCGLEKYDKNILKCVWGNARDLWTKDSIDSNKNELILYFTLSYSLLAIFIISFINMIIIYSSNNEKT